MATHNNTVIWVFRTKSCRKFQGSFFGSLIKQILGDSKVFREANRCFSFLKQLYDTFYNNNIFYDKKSYHAYTAEKVMEKFKENCRINSTSGAIVFSEKLNGSLTEPDPTDHSEYYTFDSKHTRRQLNTFGNLQIVTGCDSDDTNPPFDFFKHYCSPTSVAPNCILSDEAFDGLGLVEQQPADHFIVTKAGMRSVKALWKFCHHAFTKVTKVSKWGCIRFLAGKKKLQIEDEDKDE